MIYVHIVGHGRIILVILLIFFYFICSLYDEDYFRGFYVDGIRNELKTIFRRVLNK